MFCLILILLCFQMIWRKESVSDRRKQGMRNAGSGVLRWKKTRSKANVSRCHVAPRTSAARNVWSEPSIVLELSNLVLSFSDPEVHIGLENLQQFPAFGLPPSNYGEPVYPEFLVAPPSPLSSSPASGETCSSAPPIQLTHFHNQVIVSEGLAADEILLVPLVWDCSVVCSSLTDMELLWFLQMV